MTKKSRVQKLEEKIIPKKKTEVGHFMSSDYKNEKEMEQAIDKWLKSLPEDCKGVAISHVLSEEMEGSDDQWKTQTKYKGQENDT